MNHTQFNNLIEQTKSNFSCVRFLNDCGITVSRSGECIHAPHQIRIDSNPSFGVWDTGAYDFATGKFYDIFALCAIIKHNGDFKRAFEELTGESLSAETQSKFSLIQQELSSLKNDVSNWHNILLATPDKLEYVLNRKINLETIKNFLIGYDPKDDRIIIPYFKNGEPVYFIGRDMGSHPEIKYKKAFIKPGRYNLPWGLNTLRLGRKNPHKFLADDGELYEDDKPNPKDDILVICEGMFDILSFAQEGWQCLSPGAGDFKTPQLPFVFDICRNYKKVFICFDNDTAGKNFSRKWAKRLFANRIPFIVGHVPSEFQGKPIKDVNDYYCAGGNLDSLVVDAEKNHNGIVELSHYLNNYDEVDSFALQAGRFASSADMMLMRDELIRLRSGDEQKPKFDAKIIRVIFNNAMRPPTEQVIANEVLAKYNIKYRPNDSFFEYVNNRWHRVTDIEIQHHVSEILGVKASANKVSNVTRLLKAMLAYSIPTKSVRTFTFENGTLLLDECSQKVSDRFVKNSPEYFSTVYIPYKYNPFAHCPLWENFIANIFNNDKGLMRRAQMMAGSVMFDGNVQIQKLFYLLGEGANGKSTFMGILQLVYGRENTSTLRPDRLSSQFDPILLQDKLANFSYESGPYINNSEETLKAVSSGDMITAAHKGVDAESFEPKTKLFIASNSIMASRDVSEGFLRRVLFLPFEKHFSDNNPSTDKNLFEKLKAELPGIFNWCYEGYMMLQKAGKFEDIPQQGKMMTRFRESIDNVYLFTREVFDNPRTSEELYCVYSLEVHGLGHAPTQKKIYAAYKAWCAECGYKIKPKQVMIERFTKYIHEVVSSRDKKKVSNDELRVLRYGLNDKGEKVYIIPEFDITDVEIYTQKDFETEININDDAALNFSPEEMRASAEPAKSEVKDSPIQPTAESSASHEEKTSFQIQTQGREMRASAEPAKSEVKDSPAQPTELDFREKLRLENKVHSLSNSIEQVISKIWQERRAGKSSRKMTPGIVYFPEKYTRHPNDGNFSDKVSLAKILVNYPVPPQEMEITREYAALTVLNYPELWTSIKELSGFEIGQRDKGTSKRYYILQRKTEFSTPTVSENNYDVETQQDIYDCSQRIATAVSMIKNQRILTVSKPESVPDGTCPIVEVLAVNALAEILTVDPKMQKVSESIRIKAGELVTYFPELEDYFSELRDYEAVRYNGYKRILRLRKDPNQLAIDIEN